MQEKEAISGVTGGYSWLVIECVLQEDQPSSCSFTKERCKLNLGEPDSALCGKHALRATLEGQNSLENKD